MRTPRSPILAFSFASLLAPLPASSQEAAPAGSPLPPEGALATFALDPAFRIELVASEPLVADPVAIDWDARGRMWLAEMPDYPTGACGGRIRVLDDDDGDGLPDKSIVFADSLPFPTSVLPHRRGALVTAAPDILYLEDTDGDGHADVRCAVLTGLHPGNTQLRANSLLRGLDGWIYVANGRSGGRVRRPADPESAAVDISRHDFRFRPESFEVEAIAGPSQFGHAFDDLGNRFLSWNTVHIRQEILRPRDLERHPHLRASETVARIYEHAEDPLIFPIAPPPPTFNNESTRHFNASCGLTVERGGIFPPSHAGSAFACEPLVGIVHRDRLEPGPGVAMIARRIDAKKEFLASTDPWFHPVNLKSGPDGALYVVDFYRAMVEHPDYVPAELRSRHDWARGKGHGRIYRILPRGAAPWPHADLERLSLRQLAESLAHPNAWRRDTAQRLLIENAERMLADPAARETVRRFAFDVAQPLPPLLARIHALHVLDACGNLDRDPARLLVGDLDCWAPEALAHLVDVARRHRAALGDARLFAWLAEVHRRTAGRHPRLDLAVALAAGDLARPDVLDPVASILASISLARAGDEWMRTAIASSLLDKEGRFLAALEAREARARLETSQLEGLDVLAQTAAELAGAGGRDEAERAMGVALDDVPSTAQAAASGTRVARAFAIAAGLAAGLKRGGTQLRAFASAPETARPDAAARLEELFACARRAALDEHSAPKERIAAIDLLARDSLESSRAAVRAALEPHVPLDVELAAVRALAETADPGVPALLLEAWPGATAAVRAAILDALIARPPWIAAVSAALESGAMTARDIDPARRQALLRHAGEDLAPALRRQLEGTRSPRAEVVERWRAKLSGASGGDAARGREVYDAHCATCHRFAGRGHPVGPDLAGIGAKSREELLVAILDPNRSLVSGFTPFTALTRGGKALTGVIASETRSSVTLRLPGGKEETLSRRDLASLRSSEKSLMPEGLEETLSEEDLRNLLGFLQPR